MEDELSFIDAVQYICWLYDSSFNKSDINNLRYKLFCRKNLSGDKLPPTQDALSFHIKRAAYQSFIWKNAHMPIFDLPSPMENGGWKEENGDLLHVLMSKDPAPKEIIELISCRCKTGCSTKRCSCRSNNLNCTGACMCVDCQNDEIIYAVSSDESSDDLED